MKTQTETKHSPTPWKSDGSYAYSPTDQLIVDCDWLDIETDYANAAFIVKAVNAHDSLVDALKALMVAIDCGHHEKRMEASNPLCVQSARALLSTLNA